VNFTDKITDISHQRRLSTIVAIDMCDYSKWSQTDEDAAIDAVDTLYEICETQASLRKGRVFKRIADGFLLEFPSAVDAIHFTISFMTATRERNNLSPVTIKIDTKIGIHVGDVIDRENGDILGHGVNVAVRLQEAADRNQILASSSVINLLGQHDEFHTRSVGSVPLKNIETPIKAYAIETTPVHFLRQFAGQHFKGFKNIIIKGVAPVLLILFLFYDLNNHSIDDVLKVNDLAPATLNDGGASADISRSNITAAYIRNVLETLKHSNIPSEKSVYALLEKGYLTDGIQSLETTLETLAINDPQYINILHQIAALSYHKTPRDALSAYETILAINPDDKIASIWMFRTLNLLSRPEDAEVEYKRIIDTIELTPREYVFMTMDYAFTHSTRRDFQTAIDLLLAVQDEVIALGSPRIYAHWQTELALAFEQMDQLSDAQRLVQQVIVTLEKIGADTNLSRAYNILGLIQQKQADRQQEPEKTRLINAAYQSYNLEYETAKKINKTNDMVEGLYSMASLDLKRRDFLKAEKKYLESLRVSRKSEHAFLQLYSLLGLAETSQRQNKHDKACRYVSDMETLAIKTGIKIRKKNTALRDRIQTINCPTTLLDDI